MSAPRPLTDGCSSLDDRPGNDHGDDSHAELPGDTDAPARPPPLRGSALAWVFVGGIVGTALRYVTENLLPHDEAGWPWATFLINVAGAFVLAPRA